MDKRAWWLIAVVGLVTGTGAANAQTAPAYAPAPAVRRCLALGSLGLRVLLDSAALGGREVEIAELTLPPGWDASGPGHTHGRPEILIVLEGRLDHVVNDSSHVLEPGQLGVVRPGDRVRHRVLSPSAVRALVIWAPGGELERIARMARHATCV